MVCMRRSKCIVTETVGVAFGGGIRNRIVEPLQLGLEICLMVEVSLHSMKRIFKHMCVEQRHVDKETIQIS